MKSILVIDPKERKIVGTIPTESNTTHFFAMTKDEKKMFTSNIGAGTVSVQPEISGFRDLRCRNRPISKFPFSPESVPLTQISGTSLPPRCLRLRRRT
jgi:hypothetical protein